MYRSVANKESLENYTIFLGQGEVGLFFVFRYSIKGEVSLFFGFRFSFFDIGIRAEYRILTFEILS